MMRFLLAFVCFFSVSAPVLSLTNGGIKRSLGLRRTPHGNKNPSTITRSVSSLPAPEVQESPSLSPQKAPQEPATKVVVIGAGISGLSVAYHLQKFSSETSRVRPRLDVEILEVRDRIGGRIQPFRIDGGGSSQHNETWIDLGGQWVHESTPENPIVRLVKDDLNLNFVGDHEEKDKRNDKNSIKKSNRFHKRRLKNVLFDQAGKSMDKGIVQRAKNVFYKAMADLDEEDDDVLARCRTHGTKLSFRDLLDARTEVERRSDRRLMPLANDKDGGGDSNSGSVSTFESAMNYFVHRSEGYEGGKLHEISAVLASSLYEGSGSAPDRVVRGSYKSLLEALSSKLGLNDDTTTKQNTGFGDAEERNCRVQLRSNTRVERIEYGGSTNDRGDEKIVLSVAENEPQSPDGEGCCNGNNKDDQNHGGQAVSGSGSGSSVAKESVLDCDFCVCTVPLGVLQQRKIEFVPPLPQRRQEAIDGIGMGLLNKIVFRFDFEDQDGKLKAGDNSYKFWGNLKQFGICHEDPALVKTYYDCTDDYYHSLGDEKETSSVSSAILVQFLAGSAADRVDPPLASNIDLRHGDGNINGHSGDNNNTDSIDSKGLTDAEVIRESLEALRSVFGSENVPNPAVAKVTRWRNDPWSCGSYSFAKVGSSPSMYDEIASPLGRGDGSHNDCDRNGNGGEGRLLFAGEHTSKHFHSTVHGAWETGAREAERIIEQIRHNR